MRIRNDYIQIRIRIFNNSGTGSDADPTLQLGQSKKSHTIGLQLGSPREFVYVLNDECYRLSNRSSFPFNKVGSGSGSHHHKKVSDPLRDPDQQRCKLSQQVCGSFL